ncbi:hypothetical protein, partial [Streptomyces sp. 8P21H-1]|uniref:hypothetical protein n=1 Tax=Streptomyces sp. 8P21H-1 TaxID=2737048 RepID=UPI00156E4BB0
PQAVGASAAAVPEAAPAGQYSTALPAGSGTGRRVVYSLDDNRVWLVDPEGRVLRTFLVSPGTVDPLPARYTVTSRSNAIVGSDGVAVEHVVRFANVDGISIGFSAPTDGRVTLPDPTKKLGGIRGSKEDATAMWHFATIGTTIEVTG